MSAGFEVVASVVVATVKVASEPPASTIENSPTLSSKSDLDSFDVRVTAAASADPPAVQCGKVTALIAFPLVVVAELVLKVTPSKVTVSAAAQVPVKVNVATSLVPPIADQGIRAKSPPYSLPIGSSFTVTRKYSELIGDRFFK